METLPEIIAALKASKEPDRKIDVALETWLYHSGRNWYGHLEEVPKFTGMVDAARELAGRLHPGAMWRISDHPEDGNSVAEMMGVSGAQGRAAGATWQNAILCASLEAIPQ